MSLIEPDIYNLFPNPDLAIDFTSGLVPDSPNKVGQKKNSFLNSPPIKHQVNGQQQSNQQNQQNQQQQQQQQNVQMMNQNIYMAPNNMVMEEQLFTMFLSPEKDQSINIQNSIDVNNNNNNFNYEFYNTGGVVPDASMNPNLYKDQQQQNIKIQQQHQNHQHQPQQLHQQQQIQQQQIQQQLQQHQPPHLQQHQNYIVPESVFEIPFSLSSMNNMNQHQHQHQQMMNNNINIQNNNNNNKQFKQQQPQQTQIQPNQSLIPIPPAPTSNNNNNNNIKKKEEDKTMKKRKFITSTPVKGENGTTLIPTPDGSGNIEEERHMKRQRRLVKNREAAQLFRQRQKAYIQDLEKKVSDLTGTNSEYRARVELLNSENKLIREQLLYLRNFVTQAVSFSFPKGANGSSSPSDILGSMPGMNSPLPQGILPPGMMNNSMIMSAIAEAASKNSAFRQGIQGTLLGTPIPSPSENANIGSPTNSSSNSTSNNSSGNNSPMKNNILNQQQVPALPYLSQSTPPQQSNMNNNHHSPLSNCR
ncbi:hypothetical protein CYY_001520 [Polysphondylium violaceum]|uniref:BZIP domain-containing protein n=1 Tax=Polysphondylium violaceum TaxID=133409 RepID=A0A8J4Q1U5_9MYCE|nr:hypothetical protein CYY_001520 [Polysphondylium violaceum]